MANRASASHRQLLTIFGDLKEVVLPTDDEIDTKVAEIVASMDVPTREVEFTMDVIRSLQIMHPSNEQEQHAIAVRLDNCVNVIKQFGCQLNKYRSLKTALMQDLLTGKVRVTALLTEPQETGA